MSHAIGPLLYTDIHGEPAVLEVSTIYTITANTSKSRDSRSFIQLVNGLPIDAMEPPMTLFRRWVEVLAYSIPREPANFPGYAEPKPEPKP